MGKLSSDERQLKLKDGLQQRWSKNCKRNYLKPGALAKIRDINAACKSLGDVGKKRVAILSVKQTVTCNFDIHHKKSSDQIFVELSPQRFQFSREKSPSDAFVWNTLQIIPSTPNSADRYSESRLESLPLDLLVKILCHLRHDQLKEVFHVSQKIRRAVILARQFHFNYTTPDRKRKEMSSKKAPLHTDQLPSIHMRRGKGISVQSPKTPKAPRQGPRPPSHLNITEMREIAGVLFPEPSFSSKCLVPSVIEKPNGKSLASNRVLFCEDELCHAVSQNKLL